jgi:chromosome partitioning protein
MAAIAVATTKGGVGKTRTVYNLAGTFLADGYSVMVVDADPRKRAARNINLFNARMVRLAEEGHLPVMPAIAVDDLSQVETEAAAMKLISKYKGEYDVVLIDLAGSANQLMLVAMGRADLVLIPVQASADDVDGVTETMPSVESAREMTGRDIPVRVLFTRTPSGFPTTIGKKVRASLQGAGYDVMGPEFMNRTIFQEQSFNGCMPTVEDPASAAAQNVRAIYDEIIRVLTPQEVVHG